MKKNIFLKSIKDDHADGYRSGSGLIRSILGDSELPSQKNRTFITIWKSWFSYEFPLAGQNRKVERQVHSSHRGTLRMRLSCKWASKRTPKKTVFYM